MATDEESEKREEASPEHVATAENVEAVTLAGVRHGPNWFITLLWFIFVGSWLSALWSFGAWLLIISVIGMPLGNAMLNHLPHVAALQPPLRPEGIERPGPVFWLWRALYFVLVGWWLSLVWLSVAWAVSLTLIGLPLAVAMWNRTPAITTLARY